jgi:hypothetical protein
MPTVAEELALAVQKAMDGSEILYDVANGPDTDIVQTNSGPVPTINKWFKDKNESVNIYLDGKINAVIGPVTDQANAAAAAAQTATTAAQASNNSAILAQDHATTATTAATQTAADRAATTADAASALASKNAAQTSALEAATDRAAIQAEINKTFGAAVPVGSVVAFQSRAHLAANQGYMPLDGQLVNRSDLPASFLALITGGTLPVVTEADWNSLIYARASYTTGNGSTTVRFPDLNGKSSGSYGAAFLRGDGANAQLGGIVQRDAIKAHTHTIPLNVNTGSGSGGGGRFVQDGGTGGSATTGSNGDNETRPINTAVVWAVRVYGLTQAEPDVQAEQARDDAIAAADLADLSRIAAQTAAIEAMAAQSAAEQAATDAEQAVGTLSIRMTDAESNISDLDARTDVIESKLSISVKDFGAIGNGVVDDTAAFQAAFDAAGNRGVVSVPPGSYSVGQLNIPYYGFTLIGDSSTGHGSVLLLRTGNTKLINITAPTFSASKLVFTGISNTTEKGSDTSETLLHFDASGYSGNIDAQVENCTFLTANTCFYMGGRNLKITESLFSNCRFGVVVPTGLSDARGLDMLDNRYHSMGKTNTGASIVSVPGNADFTDLLIDGGIMDDCCRMFTGFSGIMTISNILGSRNRDAFVIVTATSTGISADRRSVTIKDNTVHIAAVTSGSSTPGYVFNVIDVSASFAMYVEISGNKIRRCPANGIRCASAFATIENNTVANAGMLTGSTYYGFLIQSNGSKVSDNQYIQDTVETATNKALAGFAFDTGAFKTEGNRVHGATTGTVTPYVLLNNAKVQGWAPKEYGPREELASVAPTSGNYNRGDIVWNLQPAASGFVGWICVTAGSPGTWKTFGAISA